MRSKSDADHTPTLEDRESIDGAGPAKIKIVAATGLKQRAFAAGLTTSVIDSQIQVSESPILHVGPSLPLRLSEIAGDARLWRKGVAQGLCYPYVANLLSPS